MTENTARLRDELAAVIAAGRAADTDGVDHPSIDELARYCGDVAEPSSAEAIAEHLTGCRACLDQVLEIEGFLAPPPEPSTTTSIADARAWRDLRARLPGGSRWWRPLVAAASVLLVAGRLAGLVYQQRANDRLTTRLAVVDAPRPDVPIVDLFPQGGVRSPGEPRSDPLPADAELVVLLLNAPDLATYASYSADLVGTNGEVLWSGALRMSAYDTFRLAVPRRWLDAAGGTVRLYGSDTAMDRRRLLTTFPIEIGPSGEEEP